MTAPDAFEELGRYYDQIMEEINYDRWVLVTTRLADLIGRRGFRHLDVACGTGKLVKRLKKHGWNSFGADVSWGMVRAGNSSGALVPLAQADMQALPFADKSMDLVTCLFDSLNFLLDPRQVQQAIREFERVLRPEGIVYFDFVTERMVTEHFANQKWTEVNGRFSTTWTGTYDKGLQIADTSVQVNSGITTVIRERVYPTTDMLRWTENARLNLLGAFDAESWTSISRRTIRADMVATPAPLKHYARAFKKIVTEVQEALA